MIVDDQAGFREAARTALDPVERHQPTAVLLDVRLGDDDGFAVCGELTRLRPDLAVLLVSDAEYEDFTDLIPACGARGFVRKSRLARVDFGEFWPSV